MQDARRTTRPPPCPPQTGAATPLNFVVIVLLRYRKQRVIQRPRHAKRHLCVPQMHARARWIGAAVRRPHAGQDSCRRKHGAFARATATAPPSTTPPLPAPCPPRCGAGTGCTPLATSQSAKLGTASTSVRTTRKTGDIRKRIALELAGGGVRVAHHRCAHLCAADGAGGFD